MGGDQTRLIVKDLKKPVGGKEEGGDVYLNVNAISSEGKLARELATLQCLTEVLGELRKLNFSIDTIME